MEFKEADFFWQAQHQREGMRLISASFMLFIYKKPKGLHQVALEVHP